MFLGQAALRPETTVTDTTLGYTLFDMLVPPEFKEYAPQRQRLALQVDAKAASLPWELLHDRNDRGARPLSVDTGMIRQLLDTTPGERRREPPSSTALVIGNPLVTDPRFAPLPGAEQEAAAVAERLRATDYAVTALLGKAADPRSVIVGLHEKPWRVLHIAAHGVFELKPKDGAEAVTGVVLDQGLFLTPGQLTQMTYVPELVFVNCCHLGTTQGEAHGREFHRLAANVATQFIRMGARAVVAAGWAVHDAAARDFAVRFYSEMLAGKAFGEAVQRAREQVYESYKQTNTWGAYQCYGDAGFILRKGDTSLDHRPPVDPRELTDWARNIAERATTVGDDMVNELRRELDDRVAKSRPAWLADAALCAALGRAYAELADFDKALDFHRRFMQAERAEGSVRALEQLANITGRRAVEEITPNSAKALTAAKHLLSSLIAVSPTSERCSLLGGIHKRQALVAVTHNRRNRKAWLEALRESLTAYDEAAALARKDPALDPWLALTNAVAIRIVLSWGAGRLPAETRRAILDGLADLEREASSVSPTAPEFWPLSRGAEHKLLTALWRRKIGPETRAEIEADHRDAAQRGRSRRQLDSVMKQLRFLKKFAEVELPARPLAEALESLYQSLAGAGK
jgi:hypothetical protein